MKQRKRIGNARGVVVVQLYQSWPMEMMFAEMFEQSTEGREEESQMDVVGKAFLGYEVGSVKAMEQNLA